MFSVSVNRSAYRILLVAGVLLAGSILAITMLRPTLAQDSGAIEYAEKGTGPVATYTAVDPEQTAIVSWTLAGTDAGVFDIEGGVLTFKKSPNYEMPVDAMGTSPSTATAEDNIYEVTVEATDATKRVGKKEVTVEVTNVEEGGSMRLSAVQPQAGTSFYVIDEVADTDVTDIKDEDVITSSVKWQWSRSRSKTTGFTGIDKATNAAYTPKDTDNGYYLRVTASYTDREGPDKSAQATSSYPVQLAPSQNAAPKFADDQDPDTVAVDVNAARSIAENTPKGVDIGSLIEASDLNPGKLTYTLEGTDASSFDIDRETGQLKTKAVLDREDSNLTDSDNDDANGLQLEVMVRATDPSGDPQMPTADAGNSDIVTVVITVEDLAEDPQISDESIDGFEEVGGTITEALATFTAVTEDTDSARRWSLAGPDAGKLQFATPTQGALTFIEKPDYEDPGDADGDNMYEVTVRATDDDGRTGTRDVTVEVTNDEEDGTVTLSPTQHRVGVPITATLKDDDDGVYGVMWQWYNDDVAVAANAIAGARSATYTPKASNVTQDLNAVATYHDAAGDDMADTAASVNDSPVLRDTRNKAPVFKDSKGVVITQAERSVAETAAGVTGDDDATDDDSSDNVGGTIMAEDSNIGMAAENDSLAFSLSGDDASKFLVRHPDDTETGATQNVQVEVKAGAKFDYETKDTYVVTLTATDDYGETADLELTIKITDVNDAPKLTGLGAIEYAEKGTGLVATYTAVDPEQTAIVSWTLAGTDAGVFDIEGGVLTFKKSPNYEMPVDAMGTSPSTATAEDNIYEVTVEATDATKRVGKKEVTVEVTNVEEGGSMRLSAVQPQAATSFYVIDEVADTDVTDIKDEDVITSSVKWQWSRSRSKTTGFTGIDKATNAAYTPKDTDNGYYLRVTASYTDREGPDKSAQATSSYPVQLAPSQNAAPKFADDQDPDTVAVDVNAARSIAENTPKGVDIGSLIEASDLNPGKLTYTLEGTDASSFDIDRETGQLKTKAVLDREDSNLTDSDNDDANGLQLEVMVRATDPSGDPQMPTADAGNSDIVTVVITVEDLAEDPQISDESIDGFEEVGGTITEALATFTAVTEDTDSARRWSLAGPDAGKLQFATPTQGALTFIEKPDYEDPGDADGDNMYEVTVRATDDDGRTGTRDVTVEVTNDEEDGTVTLSPTQHRVGVPITATLKDDDDGVYGVMWQWYNDDVAVAANAIAGARSATYTPKASNVTQDLNAVATYHDAAGDDMADTAASVNDSPVLRDTRNKAPVFKDSKGVVITQAERSVAETAAGVTGDDDATDDDSSDNVGGTIMAEDSNIGMAAENDSLAFSLSGDDASKFLIRHPDDTETGATQNVQVEVKAGAKFDYETKDTYVVTLTATDDYGETADLELTIKITDVNEAPEIMAGGLAISGMASVNYAEDRRDAVATYAVSGPDADMATWTLEGADAGDFRISTTGVLTFRTTPNYETPADMDGNNVYMVTVEANDGTYMDTHAVTVMVTNVDEDGMVTLSSQAPVVGTALTASLTDADGETTGMTWRWASSDAMDGTFTPIEGATSNSYTPVAADVGKHLRATAMYTDGHGPEKTAIGRSESAVTDVDEADRTRDEIRLEIEEAILAAVLSDGIDDAERSAIEQLILEFALTPSS